MKVNKYSVFEYEDFPMPYDDMDTDIRHWHSKLVKVRKDTTCAYCGSPINKGDYALTENGFLENKPFRVHNCIDCLDDLIAMCKDELDSDECYSRWETRAKSSGYLT